MSDRIVTARMRRAGAQFLENSYDALPSQAEELAEEMFLAMLAIQAAESKSEAA